MSKRIYIGNVPVGSGAPIAIQSMTNTLTADVSSTVEQINSLAAAGCDIVRCAVPDMESAKALAEIKKRISIPLVADIHFDYKLALASIESGVDKVRINPGNIGSAEGVKAVAEAAKSAGVPIRIGVNSGSVEKNILAKHGSPTAAALVESAEEHMKLLTDFGFHDILVSLKASDVKTTIEAYRIFASKYDYPLHLGVTEAGTYLGGTVKSAVGIGSLLADGIGDTFRVSLTDEPIKEIVVAREILKALDLTDKCARLVSCPTCGRTKIDLIPLAKKVEEYLLTVNKPITVAVMGCAVNGPGEAREADIGIAGGNGEGLIFRKGEIIRKVPEDKLFEELKKEIENL
ncbi:MAG: flavodoxin-dependent (E)-4-hydroxy-3-methylbut-2-enyl-diphosphate synthase [Clostridia bacterium]|nr:flavodoxin-dependent (E)-4-hydroxy-3-methylbut-2-enyl-diphosphate synthase [Clostridia bacterium]